jgi:GntR family transcriptional repressor for pyruvate dehydrogenase complex
MRNERPEADPLMFREIEYRNPTDLIISQLKALISDGYLKPGDRLPAERALAERFSAGRGYIRKALQKLEFYGIVTTHPQRGTFVSSLGVKSLEGLISNILQLEKDDFESIIETRSILEAQAAALAAERASEAKILSLRAAHEEFRVQVEGGADGLEEDLLFHLRIAEGAGNSVLASLIGMITPEILRVSRKLNTCKRGRYKEALEEHERILRSLEQRDPTEAERAMREHMSNTKVLGKS